jgi:hypothetical protein
MKGRLVRRRRRGYTGRSSSYAATKPSRGREQRDPLQGRLVKKKKKGLHGRLVLKTTNGQKKKCYTVLRRLRRNERLANERVQQGRTRGCRSAPLQKAGTERTC